MAAAINTYLRQQIAIHILDTNNKVPVLETDKFSATVWIYEDADEGDEVGQLIASDLDRDRKTHII